MVRPSQADILASQLQTASNRTPSSPDTPWLSDSRSSPSSSPELPKKNMFKPREAIARRRVEDEEDDEEEEEFIGYGKPKKTGPKESLMDLLSSDPPWSINEIPLLPLPTSHSKQSFGRKFLGRRRMGSTPVADSEHGNGGLRSTKSSGSLGKVPNFDDFSLSLSPQTKKLTAKGAEGRTESTRDLADFLRQSEPPLEATPPKSMRGRASTAASYETSTTNSSRLNAAMSRSTGRSEERRKKESDETELIIVSNPTNPETSSLGSGISGIWRGLSEFPGLPSPTHETVSPSASERVYQHSLSSKISEKGLTRKSSLAYTGSLGRESSTTSSRKPPSRKPVPASDEASIQQSTITPAASVSYINKATLAMIIGESPEPAPASPSRRTTSTGRRSPGTTSSSVQNSGSSYGDSVKLQERPIHRDSTTQTTPPKERPDPLRPAFKFTRRPATADAVPSSGNSSANSTNEDNFHSQRSRTNTGSSLGSNSGRLGPSTHPRPLSPTSTFRPRRAMSPAPDAPLPPPPGRNRPHSIAINPISAAPLRLSAVNSDTDSPASIPEIWGQPLSRVASNDSFVDPPLSRRSHCESFASSRTLISSQDPIFIALRVLQQTMRQGASIKIPPSIFAPLDGENSPEMGITRGQLEALVPSLSALHCQMTSAANLLDVVLKRARAAGNEEGDSAEEAAAADFLLGGGGFSTRDVKSPDDFGNGEPTALANEDLKDAKDEAQDTKEPDDPGEATDDDFPLLVKHLSVQR
ncbi:hypothetical protein P7C70_g5192, partial [Phenoliferia sp. Uapishka_3]